MTTHFNTRQAAIGGETYVGRQTKGGSRRSAKALEEASLHGLTTVTCDYFTILCHSTDQRAFWHYLIPQDFTFPIPENSLDAFNGCLMVDQVTNQMMANKQKIRRSWKSIDRYQCIDALCRSAQQFGYAPFSTRHNIYLIKSDVASTLIVKKHVSRGNPANHEIHASGPSGASASRHGIVHPLTVKPISDAGDLAEHPSPTRSQHHGTPMQQGLEARQQV